MTDEAVQSRVFPNKCFLNVEFFPEPTNLLPPVLSRITCFPETESMSYNKYSEEEPAFSF